MTLKQKFQNEIETESTASLNMGDVLSWGVLIFGEGQGSTGTGSCIFIPLGLPLPDELQGELDLPRVG